MAILKIRNNQPRILGLVSGHRLMPGRNKVQELEITEDQLKRILNDGTFKTWQKVGWVSVLQNAPTASAVPTQEVVDEGPEEALGGLRLGEAKTLIGSTSDQDLLKAWAAKDGRRGIKKAVAERLEELQPPEEVVEEAQEAVADSADDDGDDDLDEIFGDD